MIIKCSDSDIQLIRQKKPSSAVGVLEPVFRVQSQSRWKPTTTTMHCFLLIGEADVPLFSRHALSLAVPQLQTSVRVTSIPKSLYLICAPSEYDQTNECPQRGKQLTGSLSLWPTCPADAEETWLASSRWTSGMKDNCDSSKCEHRRGFNRWASNELAFIVPPLKSSLHVSSSKFKDYKFLRSETTKPSCYFFFFKPAQTLRGRRRDTLTACCTLRGVPV